MFNFKKEEKQNPPASTVGNKINMGNMPIHTMQDDLDILEGKKPQTESSSFVSANNSPELRKESNTFFNNDGKAVNTAGSSSPFLNGASISSQKSTLRENRLNSEMPNSTSTEPEKDIDAALGGNLPVSDNHAKKISVLGRILFIIAIVLVIAAFAFGGYYFWTTRVSNNQASIRDESEIASNQTSSSETLPETTTESPTEIVQSKFSESNPNYLSIDIGMTTADSVSKLFIEKASEIKDSGLTSPVEFIVTDTNNDPVSFSAFNYISGMKFPVDILTNLGDKFSLYFFNDNGNMRMGIAMELKDKNKVTSGIKNEEKNLVVDLAPLFIGADVKNNGKIFKSGSYNNFSIIYNNLDEQGLISVDYSITDKYLVIGTSKQAMFSVLDKISK